MGDQTDANVITEEFKEAIRRYLDEKHCNLYLNWEIKTKEGMEAAVEFLVGEFKKLMEIWYGVQAEREEC